MNLVPKNYKNVIKIINKISIICIVMTLIFIPALTLGVLKDIESFIIFFVFFISTFVVLSIPGFRYDRVSQSIVCLTDDGIQAVDKKGRCWRFIDYRSISMIKKQELVGFFYGFRKDEGAYDYICIYLNGNIQIPDVAYSKLYNQNDFFLISYDKELYKKLLNKCGQTEDGSVSENQVYKNDKE